MTDKTKSSVKEDANKDAPKPQEAAAPELVKAEPEKGAPEKPAEAAATSQDQASGKDTVQPETENETITNEEEQEGGEADALTLDTVKIKELIDQIENAGGQSPMDLSNRLTQEEGAKFRKTSEGRIYVKIAGIEAGARTGQATALQNWCNAARRALLKAA